MEQPHWAKFRIAPIDYQTATYYSAPKQRECEFPCGNGLTASTQAESSR